MKIKYRLLPVEPYEVSALETWLSDLSAEGLHLLEIKEYYASFWVKEPERMLYRMEPKKYRKEEFPDWDKLRFYEEYGWKYATTFGEYFHIYTAKEGTPEIHTDPIVESELYHVFRMSNKHFLLAEIGFWGILIVLCIVRNAWQIFNENAYMLVHGNYSLVLWLPLFITLVNLPSFRKAYGIQRIQKKLASGTPLSHNADWRGKLRHKRWLSYVCGIMTAVFFFLSYFPDFLDYSNRPMAEIQHPLPFVALAEIENSPNYVPLRNRTENHNEWSAETISFQSSIGAPVQYSINQRGVVKGKANPEGNLYKAELWLDYKKFSFLVTPQEYLEEFITRHKEEYGSYLPKDGWTETTLEDTPFDYALLLQKDNHTELYMILGNKMLEADYIGGQDLTQCYGLFLEVLQKDYHR